MTRSRWTVIGAGALVVALTIVLGVVVLGPGRDSRPVSTGAPEPPEYETLFLPGLEHPDEFTLPDPSTAEGEPLTARLSADETVAHRSWSLGLSFDARELANPMWGAEDSNLALTLSELDRPALRFGGNGIDRHVWWTSSEEPTPDWASATVTPADLERVAAVAEEVDATVTIVLDLGHDDPARAADMAAHAREALGDRLLAVAIGNEPNGFHHDNQPQLAVRDESWTPETYQQALTDYSETLEEASPGIPVAGPGAYDAPWWRAFAESGIPHQKALSMHWYPLWDCEGPASSSANPTIEDLVSPEQRERAEKIVTMGSEVADEHDLPLWMEETGPTSCSGTNETSLTHAQALWTVDYTLTLAELGVERIAFHSTLQACRGGAPMSPICARGDLEEPGQIVEGRTSFLALSLLGEIPEGEFLPVTVGGDGTTSVHAVLDDDGQLTLVVVDLRDPANQSETVRPVQVSMTDALSAAVSDGWRATRGAQLSGESLDAPETSAGDLAPVSGALSGAHLRLDEPLTLVSSPGTVTVLELAAASSSGTSDDRG